MNEKTNGSSCARKTLERAGITWAEHVEITSLGFAKGKSPADLEKVSRVIDEGAKMFKRGNTCCS